MHGSPWFEIKKTNLSALSSFSWVDERFGELLGEIVGIAWISLPNLHACPNLGF
jgi:hypothetical protein